MTARLLSSTVFVSLCLAPALFGQHHHPPRRPVNTTGEAVPLGALPSGGLRQELASDSVTIALVLSSSTSDQETLHADDDFDVALGLSRPRQGLALRDAVLAAWIDRRGEANATGREQCRAKIESYIQGTLRVRPTVDLTSYFVVTLNNGNSLSVIDPFIGFGTTKLYTRVVLRDVGDDWALSPDGSRLFVSLPRVNAVAVVNTSTWKVDAHLNVGSRPGRVVFAPDGRLWVASAGTPGGRGEVAVFDAATLGVVATLPTGTGRHDVTFTADGRLAFVTSYDDSTMTVMDAAAPAARAEIATGRAAIAIAYSRPEHAVYVAHEDGNIAIVDVGDSRLVDRLETGIGLAAFAFDPSGRWGFAVDSLASVTHIVDAASRTVRYRVPFGERPDQVSFTQGFAYVRSTGTVDVGMIPLSALGEADSVPVIPFPAGELPPNRANLGATASAIAPPIAGDPHMADAVYVPNPADKSIYYYHYMEGMPTPSGRLNNYGLEPRAVLAVGRHLRETAPGVYGTTARVPAPGSYDLVLLLDAPRVIHCFPFEVEPALERAPARQVRFGVAALPGDVRLPIRDTATVRLRLTDLDTGEPMVGASDLLVLAASPTGWQRREPAHEIGDGIYEVRLVVPRAGVYYLSLASRVLRLRFQDHRPVILRTRAEGDHDRR